MRWDDVETFIRSKSPDLLADAEGVEAEDLAALEAETELPRAYRDFLLRCGVSSGDLHPMGHKWDHDFYQLVEQPPEDEFLAHGLLRVGSHADDSAISPNDIYLDLRAADGEDAPLVESEQGAPYDPAWVLPRGTSFLDQVVLRAFHLLQFDGLEHQAQLSMPLNGNDRAALVEQVRQVLQRMGLVEILAPSDRVVVLDGEGVSVVVQVPEGWDFGFVRVGGAERKAVGRAIEVLLDNVAGLQRDQTSAPLEDPS